VIQDQAPADGQDQARGADFLQLDPAAARHGRPTEDKRGLGDWLTAALRDAVGDGRLTPGVRLPATRALAAQLGISRGVVVDAYRRLADEGLLGGRRGGGTTVLTAPAASRPAPAEPPPPRVAIDLRPGVPDLSAFPRQAWLRAERAALGRTPDAALGYGDPRGTVELRTALAGWLARSRGVRADPSAIMVVGGVAQGLALVAQVLTRRDVGRVGYEDPGSRGTRDQLERWGLRLAPVPVDDLGLDVDALAGTAVDTVFVTPAHQYPTGVVLAPQRRRALLDWARAGGLVIEDDYDAEHRYDRAPVAALAALAPEHVVYLGSVSKTLAPALRLGWVIAPPQVHEELVVRKQWSDITSPALGQLALAELITSGGFERHLRAVRTRQRQRRDALAAALHEHLPDARVHGVAAGLHLVVGLPGGVDDAAVAARAEAAGVGVQPLSYHRLRPGPPGLVIGYAATTPDRLREGVRLLAGAVREVSGVRNPHVRVDTVVRTTA
jgi:GntR family transcriptional regulator/MocR family aminotransferase